MTLRTSKNERSAPRPRVLVVEDEWLIAEDFGDILDRAGFEIVGPANTAEEARNLIRHEKFSAALLDINLSDGTSFKLGGELTERGIPFAYVTGYNKTDLPDFASSHILLNKPISDSDLPAVVTRLLKRPSPQEA